MEFYIFANGESGLNRKTAMPLTAVEILVNKNVLNRVKIKKISEKWWKRTARSINAGTG